MSWVVIVWSMMAASSLTLAVIHLFVWFRQRGDYSHLLVFPSRRIGRRVRLVRALAHAVDHAGGLRDNLALGAGAALRCSCCRWSDSSTSTSAWAALRWLALATCATRLAALVLNFTTGVNVNFREVTGLDQSCVLGRRVGGGARRRAESVDRRFPKLSNVMLMVLVIGAAVTVWRRGDRLARRRALVVGGSLVLCVGFAAVLAALSSRGSCTRRRWSCRAYSSWSSRWGTSLRGTSSPRRNCRRSFARSEARFRAVVQSVPDRDPARQRARLDRLRERTSARGIRLCAGRARGQAGRRPRAIEGA